MKATKVLGATLALLLFASCNAHFPPAPDVIEGVLKVEKKYKILSVESGYIPNSLSCERATILDVIIASTIPEGTKAAYCIVTLNCPADTPMAIRWGYEGKEYYVYTSKITKRFHGAKAGFYINHPYGLPSGEYYATAVIPGDEKTVKFTVSEGI
jgi:hypothetical protein